mgnify:CR=1 FL=1
MAEERDLKKISFLKTPQTALGLFKIPQQNLGVLEDLTVALDGVRDPGNLGTIIRLCDWFGVKNLVCSTDTVDCFNPKVKVFIPLVKSTCFVSFELTKTSLS